MVNDVKLLFWNLKRNSNEKWVAEVIKENDIDVAIFAEYQGTSFFKVEELLSKNYKWHDGNDGCEKVTIIVKKSVDVSIRREQNRYTIYYVSIDSDHFIIAGVHLPAPPTASASDRKDVIRDLVRDIGEQERERKNHNTIVIGDFNCNPFDEEIVEKSAMNAVLFKKLIDSQEYVRHQEKLYRRFYNPTLHYLSETTKTYGSIYNSSGNAQIYWNSFDQIMVRKELTTALKEVLYLTSINGKNLIKRIKPDDSISDHLPLLATIEKGV